jgi:hypothetical protein
MASEERSWPRWVRIAVRIAIFAAFALTGALARHRDTQTHASVGPPDGYTARFPVEARRLIHPGVDLYYFRDSVGHVIATSVDSNQLVVRVLIDADSSARIQEMNPAFQVYRDSKHPSEAWIGVIPKDADGKPMSPKEAARIWGREA